MTYIQNKYEQNKSNTVPMAICCQNNPSINWNIYHDIKIIQISETNLLAPVQTIFPELNIRAVVLGSRILMMTAANRLGLYSAFLA